MNIQLVLKTLKDHAKEEVRIHKEIFNEASGDVKDLVGKHINDTISIHKAFWKKLKKAAEKYFIKIAKHPYFKPLYVVEIASLFCYN